MVLKSGEKTASVTLGLTKIKNNAVKIHKFVINSPNLNKLFNDIRIMKFKDIVT